MLGLMGLFEKDYLLRLLEQLTEMVAAVRGAIGAGKNREALATIAEAQQRLAGPLGASLERLDAGSVVSLLGAEKARMHAQLLRLEAEARDGLGEAARARTIEARAEGIRARRGVSGPGYERENVTRRRAQRTRVPRRKP